MDTGDMSGVELWVGTKNGLFRYDSDEARRSWRLHGPFLPGWTISALHFPEPDGGRLLAATCHLAYGPTIRASTDGGETWRQFVGSPRYSVGDDRGADKGAEGSCDPRGDGGGDGSRYGSSHCRVKQVWCLAGERTRAGRAAGTTHRPRLFAGVEDAGVFVSDDGGSDWREMGSFAKAISSGPHSRRNGVAVDAVIVDPAAPERIWVCARRAGVFRSRDGGESFERCDSGLPDVVMLAQNPIRPDELYAQTVRGMFRTTDGGDTWQPDFKGLPSAFGFTLHVAPDGAAYTIPLESQTERHVKDGRLCIYRKVMDGDAWESLRAGLPTYPYYAGVLRTALDSDLLAPNGVYFGTTSGEVFASIDRGQSWQKLPGGFTRITTVKARALTR